MTRTPFIDQMRTGRPAPADGPPPPDGYWSSVDVLWGVARRNGHFDIEDPQAHAGLTQHAFPLGRDEESVCGYRPPKRRDEWSSTPRPMLALPSDAYNPRCDRCQARLRSPWAIAPEAERMGGPSAHRPPAAPVPGGMTAVPITPLRPVAIPIVVPLPVPVGWPPVELGPLPVPQLVTTVPLARAETPIVALMPATPAAAPELPAVMPMPAPVVEPAPEAPAVQPAATAQPPLAARSGAAPGQYRRRSRTRKPRPRL